LVILSRPFFDLALLSRADGEDPERSRGLDQGQERASTGLASPVTSTRDGLRKERERALDRAGRQRAWKQLEADVAAGRVDLLPLSAEVLAASRHILEACHPHVALRSLDAIHLASASRLQSWPLCTNDLRMREAAVRLGMPLCLLPRTA